MECVATNSEGKRFPFYKNIFKFFVGTHAISGSFDKCLKVWNTEEEAEEESEETLSKNHKRARHDVKTRVCFVDHILIFSILWLQNLSFFDCLIFRD